MADNPKQKVAMIGVGAMAALALAGSMDMNEIIDHVIGIDPAFPEPPVPTVEENFIDTALTLKFPEPTEAEKQKAIERAAQDLAYEAAASERTKAKSDERKMLRGIHRFRSHMLGGFVSCPPNKRFEAYTSTRGDRRRAQLGRA